MNKDYTDLLDVVTAKLPNVTTMTIDTVDLSDFYQKVNYAEKGEVFHSLDTHGIMENTKRCNFGFRTEMGRGLDYA